ncbi:MAG: hypothetical protein ACE5HT_04810 [Gemmatimonadales bacterium]
MILAACGAASLRPAITPFPQAQVDTVFTAPDSAIIRLNYLLLTEGLVLHVISPVEGFVETEWFDAETLATGDANSLDTKDLVRLRFWADAVQEGQTVVVGEATNRISVDPSLPIRQKEAVVPPEHPAHAILTRILDALRSSF